MQDIKIGLIQTTQVWEDKQANLIHFEEKFAQMEACDLILLPEMFTTGFSMHADKLAETWGSSGTVDWLKEQAKKRHCAIYTSLIIEEEGNYYNRGVFVFPDTSLVHYDKRKTFGLAGEDRVYKSGEKEVILEYKGWKINLQICYDLRFPELVRNRVSGNTAAYDIILYVANWPEKRRQHWKTLLRARAIENQCYVAGVNRVGMDGNMIHYTGDSRIVDLLGDEVKAHAGKEDFVYLTCNSSHLIEWRGKLPFLKDR